jgi:glyoxylase-like metal-dependent hydrolase (beta-lactamase superfamily II)
VINVHARLGLLVLCGIVASALRADTQQTPRVETQQRTVAPRPASPASLPVAPSWDDSGEIKVLPVQGKVYLLVGAGANIAVQVGDEGVLVVDSGLKRHADKVLAAIRTLSDGPIRWVVNTSALPDHTGGNEALSKAGGTTQGNPLPIVAHENVIARMSAPSGGDPVTPSAAWPTDAYVKRAKDFFFNAEPIMVYHPEAGVTDGDSIVLFRRSDVLVAGETWVTTRYPIIDLARGGGVQGVIDGLNYLLDMAVPEHEQEGGTYVIPGHGRVGDEADVLEYRDMVTIVRDRIQDMVSRGLTLAQVKAAAPTLDYDRQYGADRGPWTTANFVEAIYKDLSARAPAAPRVR